MTINSCESKLRVWFPNITQLPKYLPNTVEQEDETHLLYQCTRGAEHDGKHGWCQGFDMDWTYQW